MANPMKTLKEAQEEKARVDKVRSITTPAVSNANTPFCNVNTPSLSYNNNFVLYSKHALPVDQRKPKNANF